MELTDVCQAANKVSPQQLQCCDEACWCCKDRVSVKGCNRVIGHGLFLLMLVIGSHITRVAGRLYSYISLCFI